MRQLSSKFMNDLKSINGILNGLLQFVLRDDSLEFMIREEYVNIYYRGGSLLKINTSFNSYKFSFDTNYITPEIDFKLPSEIVYNSKEVAEWLKILPYLKQNIDIHRTVKKSNLEREYQQLVVKESNELNKSISNGSEIFIVDIEYANDNGRFDLIGIEWERSKASLSGNYKPKLLLIEMKFGDDALSDSSKTTKKSADIKQHIVDVENFVSKRIYLDLLKEEVLSILEQKRELGFFRGMQHNKNKVIDLDLEHLDFILLLAAHNPRSKILLQVLEDLPIINNVNLKFSVANFMGYGLYSECIYTLDEFKTIFKKQIFCN